MSAKEWCAKGHPFDAENTYIRPNGHRDCRTCNRAGARAYKRRKNGAPRYCADCTKGLITRKTWLEMTPEERKSAAEHDMAPAGTKYLCKRCHRRQMEAARLAQDGTTPIGKLAARAASRIEDLEWMAAHGESHEGAARRLGIAAGTLSGWLAAHERPDLQASLLANNPRDHNAIPDGSNVTSLSGTATDASRARDRERRRKLRQNRNQHTDDEVA